VGDPLFWLGLSLLLVAVSLTAVLVVAIPTLMELSRAARSAEKLFDTLGRELPPTLEALRLTGLEITELSENVSDGVEHAGRVVQQVDESLTAARQQAKTLQAGSRSFLAGARAAWQTWTQTSQRSPRPPSKPARRKPQAARRPAPRQRSVRPRPTLKPTQQAIHPSGLTAPQHRAESPPRATPPEAPPLQPDSAKPPEA
jgi:hypothetical protein